MGVSICIWCHEEMDNNKPFCSERCEKEFREAENEPLEFVEWNEGKFEPLQEKAMKDSFRAFGIKKAMLNKENYTSSSYAHSVYCDGFSPLKRRKNDE